MDTLVDVAQSIRGNEMLALALGGERWTPAKLGTLKGAPEAVLESLAKGLQDRLPELGFSVGDLEALVEAADNLAALERLAAGDRYRASLCADAVVARQTLRVEQERQAMRSAASGASIPKPGKAVVTKWPTKLQKRLADAGSNVQLREQAELKERERWLKDLKDIRSILG